ncbi:hypothetical protein L3X38_010604 [Prunus dulcis]|uniref:Uncharacterized protein n=1 Tax=Prunus dulcis TaxID=3755 RepID=A0AAD4ZEW8_PRUDU|nr:hypothetical protein L3X38_010604 [Prunus dulcis]
MLFTISKSFHTSCASRATCKILEYFTSSKSLAVCLQRREKMALIGEALISASVQVLCDRITSSEFVDLFQKC